MYNTQFFIMGLREEILARLQTTKFETLVATSKAAKEAKDYLNSVASLSTHQNATRVAKKVIGAENDKKHTVLTKLDHRVVVAVHLKLDSRTNQQLSIT